MKEISFLSQWIITTMLPTNKFLQVSSKRITLWHNLATNTTWLFPRVYRGRLKRILCLNDKKTVKKR